MTRIRYGVQLTSLWESFGLTEHVDDIQVETDIQLGLWTSFDSLPLY